MLRNSIFTAAALVVAVGLSVAAEHTKDPPAEVKKAVEKKSAILIDVREKSEWDAGHLKDAKLLPLTSLKKGDVKELTRDLPKDKPIYCHCGAGRRALQAAELLQKMGYDVRPLKLGYKDLVEAGFEKAADKN